ncbi:PAS domain-containing protein [Ferrovibrio xuzhouensis]|uniref:PAS domain-containing protein n=1 Tax=Ferrovibrio xuzhouensis TaxID=1576914 RepID=A0ABV7VCM9_9PROT
MSEQTPQTVTDARLSHALSCWQHWRCNHDWPTRADIDSDELRLLLPNLYVVEAVDGGRRFRYVLAGATIRNTLHFELSGRYFDELFQGDILERNMAAYHAVIGGRGEYAIQRWEQRGRPVIRFRRLLLPLASDRQCIDGVLGFALYDLLPDHDGKPIDHIHDPVTIVPEQEAILDLNPPA